MNIREEHQKVLEREKHEREQNEISNMRIKEIEKNKLREAEMQAQSAKEKIERVRKLIIYF